MTAHVHPGTLEIFTRAMEAFREGRHADAAQSFQEFLTLNPKNVPGQIWLSVSLLKAQRLEESAQALDTVLQQALPLSTLLEIVRVLIDEVAWPMADAVLGHILRHAPNVLQPQLYKAELQVLRGDLTGARQTYRGVLATYPTSFDAISKLLGLVSPAEAHEVIEIGLSHAPAGSEDKLRLLSLLALQAERIGRLSNGKSEFVTESAEDTWPRYALAELRAYRDEASAQAAQSASVFTLEHRAAAEYGLRDVVQAQVSFTQLAQIGAPGIAGIVNLEPGFYETLDTISPEEIGAGLPPVEWKSRPGAGSAPAYFLGADPAYMRDYGKAMVRSIGRNAPDFQVHVHLMNVPDEEFAQFAAWGSDVLGSRISLSRDVVLLPKDAHKASLYYHAIRFVRFFQLLEQSRRPLTLLDVDGLVKRDFHSAVAHLGNFDVALKVAATGFTPWDSFTAGVVSVRPTDRGLRYMKLVAAMIAHHYKHGTLRWGVDQLALRCCYDFLAREGAAPVLAPLSDLHMSRYAGPDAAIWMQAGKKKRIALRSADGLNADSDVRYMAAFKEFSDA